MNRHNYQYLKSAVRNSHKKYLILIFSLPVICVLLSCCAITPFTPSEIPEKPSINYFTVDKSEVESGAPVNLNWDITNADKVTIEPGIGDVSLTGTYQINPSANIEYVLTASNAAGSISGSIDIQVIQASVSSDCFQVSCDPVTGRNADISFRWEQLSLCTEYQLQIAKDSKFTLLIYDRREYTPYSTTSPGMIYLAGGIMECGHTYFIRVRCTSAATGQDIHSPWSVIGCFTVKSGLPIGR